MRAGYTAFLSLKVICLSPKNYVPVEERSKNPGSNPGSNLGLTGAFKKGLFCVRQQAGIYRINILCGFLLVTAVKQAVPVDVQCMQRA